MKTLICKHCGGIMYHSDNMNDPFPPGDNIDKTPYYQCASCGNEIYDEEIINQTENK